MAEHDSTALEVARDYFQAWTRHDFDTAMTYVSDDIVCQAPAGELTGAEAFRGFMEPFSRLLTRADLVAAFGDDTTAVLIYDTETLPVPHAPARLSRAS